MFDGFALDHVDTGEAVLRVRHGGSGPPLLLLHGHPRTHTTWHRVAPLLAGAHTVVCPDLRGYGKSAKPPTTPDHAPFSKRAMAGDMRALMAQLGFERFAVAGHDRGSYVALRLALDAPEAVTRLAVLDSVPIVEALERCDAEFAADWWHWFFFAQTAKPAEDWISRDPEAWYTVDPDKMGAENHADWRRAVHDPATVHAMVEDYRAGLGIDRAHDEADRAAGRKIDCPLLALWGASGIPSETKSPLDTWRQWANDVRGFAIDCGHYLPEENPDAVSKALIEFFK